MLKLDFISYEITRMMCFIMVSAWGYVTTVNMATLNVGLFGNVDVSIIIDFRCYFVHKPSNPPCTPLDQQVDGQRETLTEEQVATSIITLRPAICACQLMYVDGSRRQIEGKVGGVRSLRFEIGLDLDSLIICDIYIAQ